MRLDIAVLIGSVLWYLLFIKIGFNEEKKVFVKQKYMFAWALLTIFPIIWAWTYFHVFLFQAMFGSMAYKNVFLGTEQFSSHFDFYTSWASLIMAVAMFGTLVWWFYRLNNKLKLQGVK